MGQDPQALGEFEQMVLLAVLCAAPTRMASPFTRRSSLGRSGGCLDSVSRADG